MFDLLDLVAPRIYVVPDSAYNDYKEKQKKQKVAGFDAAIDSLQKRIADLEAQKAALVT
jgi:hypothetical protein